MYDVAVIVLLMGVQGSGKTTVGQALAARLGWRFADADSFHPAANVAKMSAGIPLDDYDRRPWLAALRAEIDHALAAGVDLVLSCSALKEKYRQQLLTEDVVFVYLRGSPQLIASRLRARKDHFAKLDLLASQFAQLEEPRDSIVVEISSPVAELVEQIITALPAAGPGSDSD
jgi:gluconokinase